MIVLIHDDCMEAGDLRRPPKDVWRKLKVKLSEGQGKPLRAGLAGLWSVRITKWRAIYERSGNYAIVIAVDHRDDVYADHTINGRRTR